MGDKIPRRRRCTARRKCGEPCKAWAVEGWNVCRMHGAGGGRPPTTGKRTKIARRIVGDPDAWAQEYARAVPDPDLLCLREHIALLDVRIGAAIEATADNPDLQLWERACRLVRELIDCDDPQTITEKLHALQECLEAGRIRKAADTELIRLIEQRRRVTESEVKRRLVMDNTMTLSEAGAFVKLIIGKIEQHVTSQAEKVALIRDLSKELRAVSEERDAGDHTADKGPFESS